MTTIFLSFTITILLLAWFYVTQLEEIHARFMRISARYSCSIHYAAKMLREKGLDHPEWVAAHEAMIRASKEFHAASAVHKSWMP